jgi:hypothetical protein
VKVVTETRIVEVPVEVTKPLPKTLTEPLDYPDSATLDGDVSVGDLLDLVFDLFDVVDVANADREKAAELTQPTPLEAIQP